MELWIRSQDRERLIKVFDVFVDDERIRANFQSHFSGCNYVELGEYYSNDRALKVLDEIQNVLLNLWGNNVRYESCYDDERPRSLVYEMPKE